MSNKTYISILLQVKVLTLGGDPKNTIRNGTRTFTASPMCVKTNHTFLWNPIFIILNTRSIPWLFWTRVSPIKSTDIEWVLIRSNSHFILAIIILSLTTQIKVLLASSKNVNYFRGNYKNRLQVSRLLYTQCTNRDHWQRPKEELVLEKVG